MKHRHLLEVTRALYFQSQVQVSFWIDCVQFIGHLISIMHLVTLQKKTLYQVLRFKKSNYEMFTPFGCLSYTSTLKKDKYKLDYREDPCIFISYVLKKWLKLYNLRTKMVIVSRDVYFQEISILINFQLQVQLHRASS